MKLYTNKLGNRYFIHQERVNGLSEVEVNDIPTAIAKHSDIFTIQILLDTESLVADELGELRSVGQNYTYDDAITIDFTKDLSYPEIAKLIIDASGLTYKFDAQLEIIDDISRDWSYKELRNGDIQDITYSERGQRVLHVNIDHYNEVIETTIIKTNAAGKMVLISE